MRWLTRGDIDGFFGLALDNLVQLLLIDALCRGVLGFDDELLYGSVLPGVAVSLVVGNVFYAGQAMKLARRELRADVCALPYGINTVSLFAHVFLVMLPAKLVAEQLGATDPARVAWQAGLVATLGSGLIEFGGSFVAEGLRKLAPRAALLSTLAGIALGFIALGFLFRSYARPLVGLSTLAIVLLTYFGQVEFRGRLPGGLVAVIVGTGLAWLTGIAPGQQFSSQSLGFYPPKPALFELLQGGPQLLPLLSVVVPMGLFNLIGSLQNLESAEAEGDRYPTAPSLATNGVGTLVAAAFGSCFPTTIYIGHPGWKRMGARAGYSLLNAGFFTIVGLSGSLSVIAWAVPIEAGMAIVLWIGIVISAQAFTSTPKRHAPAVVLGLLPGIGAWGTLMAKNGLRAAGVGGEGAPFSESLFEAFGATDTWIAGAFALEQGFIFSAMILSAMTVGIIERKFLAAAGWAVGGALLSACGLMHAYRFTPGDTVIDIHPAWPWVYGYIAMALLLATAPWSTVPKDKPNAH